MIQQTLVLVKPDGVSRGIVGDIIKRFEQRGLKIVGLKLVKIDEDFSKKHYAAHVDKEFYKALEKFIVSGPVVAIVIEGVEAIENVRKIVGDTESKLALPGTIRGDFSHISRKYADEREMSVRNVVHASGDLEDAGKEVALWFSVDEIHSYKRAGDEHLL